MELEKIAEDATALLASNAANDLWPTLKQQIARLLGRSHQPRIARIEQQLELLRQEITEAGLSGEGHLTDRRTGVWQGRITALLEDHPEAADGLATLIASYRELDPNRAVVSISDVRADGGATQIVVGAGDLTIGRTPRSSSVELPDPNGDGDRNND